MLKWIISNALLFITVGCTTQETNNNINDYFKMESSVINEGLKQNNFKQLSLANLEKKYSSYLGIQSKELKEDYINVGRNDYTLFVKEGFISTSSESIFTNTDATKDDYTTQDLKAQFAKRNTLIIKKIIAYNTLLFNDDPNAVHYFLQNYDDAVEIVIDFNYDQNPMITNFVINTLDINTIDPISVKNMLFNHLGKFRVELNQIIEKKKSKDFILDYGIRFIEIWAEIPTSEDKTSAIIYFLKTLNYPENANSIQEKYNYSFLEMLDKKEKNLIDKLQVDKTLDAQTYQLIKDYLIIKETTNETPIWGMISDSDGYVNIRKTEDPKSEIIDKINDGEKVEVFPTENTMWLIKNHIGKTGYIHKSRIKISH